MRSVGSMDHTTQSWSVNRKAVVIYGSTDLWIYWDKADKLRLFYRYISHNLLCEAGDYIRMLLCTC